MYVVYLFYVLIVIITILLVLKKRSIFMLCRNEILLLIWIGLSFISLGTNIENLNKFIIVIGLCIPLIIILYWYLRAFRIDSILERLTEDEGSRVSFFLLLLITYAVFFSVSDGEIGRGLYERLIASARSGGVEFFLIKTLILLTAAYVSNTLRLILILPLGMLVGSKALIIVPIFSYLTYGIVVYRWSIPKMSFIFIIVGLLIYYALINLTLGVDSVLKYYLYSYTDYLRNLETVHTSLPILPSSHIIPFINDYIIGLSRITGIYKVGLSYELFPDEMRVGKSPGLLIWENMFRTGVIFTPLIAIFTILYLEIQIYLIRLLKNDFIARCILFVGIGRTLLPFMMLWAIILTIFRWTKSRKIKKAAIAKGIWSRD